MTAWTKDRALRELAQLIQEIDHLHELQRFSAEHTRWVARTLAFLEEVFGRESRYYLTFAPIPWRKTGQFVLPVVITHVNEAIELMHQSAYLEQLESARGLLQAAADHLERVDEVSEVYQGKDTGPETSCILKIISLAERSLRKAMHDRPLGEREVQDAFENLLIGADIPYKREIEVIEYSSKTYIPDFTFPKIELALDFKFCGTKQAEKRLIKEINDYILAFRSRYPNVVFVVYDLGFIRDVDRFAGSFEDQDVVVRVVKH